MVIKQTGQKTSVRLLRTFDDRPVGRAYNRHIAVLRLSLLSLTPGWLVREAGMADLSLNKARLVEK